MPFVYFIGAGPMRDPVKIGFANDPSARMATLQISHWMPLSIIACVPGNAGLERSLHAKFVDERLSGEWFRRTPRVDAAISDLLRGNVAAAVDSRSGSDRLVEWIGASGMNRSEFAKLIGVTKGAVSHLIKRRSTPKTSTALRIAEVTKGEVPIDCWSVNHVTTSCVPYVCADSSADVQVALNSFE